MRFKAGKVIRDLIGAGQSVKLRMKLTVDMKDGLTSSNVWGTLPGTTDENIMILAHQDGYYEASLDNASGQSVMMTLLDYFSQIPKEQRRRSITFVATASNNQGRWHEVDARQPRHRAGENRADDQLRARLRVRYQLTGTA
jgi:hypothetical protein